MSNGCSETSSVICNSSLCVLYMYRKTDVHIINNVHERYKSCNESVKKLQKNLLFGNPNNQVKNCCFEKKIALKF